MKTSRCQNLRNNVCGMGLVLGLLVSQAIAKPVEIKHSGAALKQAWFKIGADGLVAPFRIEQISLADVVAAYMVFSGRDLVEGSAAGSDRVQLIVSTPMSKEALEQVMHMTLDTYGYMALDTMDKKGWIIQKTRDAREAHQPVLLSDSVQGDRHSIVTVVHHMKYRGADTLTPLMRNLSPRDARIDAVGERDIMLIDSESRIRRYIDLLTILDTPEAERNWQARRSKVRAEELARAQEEARERQSERVIDKVVINSLDMQKKGE